MRTELSKPLKTLYFNLYKQIEELRISHLAKQEQQRTSFEIFCIGYMMLVIVSEFDLLFAISLLGLGVAGIIFSEFHATKKLRKEIQRLETFYQQSSLVEALPKHDAPILLKHDFELAKASEAELMKLLIETSKAASHAFMKSITPHL